MLVWDGRADSVNPPAAGRPIFGAGRPFGASLGPLAAIGQGAGCPMAMFIADSQIDPQQTKGQPERSGWPFFVQAPKRRVRVTRRRLFLNRSQSASLSSGSVFLAVIGFAPRISG